MPVAYVQGVRRVAAAPPAVAHRVLKDAAPALLRLSPESLASPPNRADIIWYDDQPGQKRTQWSMLRCR